MHTGGPQSVQEADGIGISAVVVENDELVGEKNVR
jgi:hypothetical protein